MSLKCENCLNNLPEVSQSCVSDQSESKHIVSDWNFRSNMFNQFPHVSVCAVINDDFRTVNKKDFNISI